MTKRESATCVWDFTVPKEIEYIELAKLLDKHCKKWCFQLESGETTEYEHYQGRFSLKLKKRLKQLKEIFGNKYHFSITSNSNRENNFYVMKDETRIDGPWDENSDILPRYIPRQVREINELWPWQNKIIEMSKIWDTRHIHAIIDKQGNIGKSILVTYMGVNKMSNNIPFCNDYKDILRMVMDRPKRRCYTIDIPRAINKEKLFQMYGAIETVKSGYAYDDRYKFKEDYFDSPNIFVFTNVEPDTNLLSIDRWKFWKVENKELKEF